MLQNLEKKVNIAKMVYVFKTSFKQLGMVFKLKFKSASNNTLFKKVKAGIIADIRF